MRAIQQLLSDRGVPAVLQTEESVFDAPEASVLLLVLRAVLDAGSQTRLATALQTSFFGFDAERLDAVRRDEQQLSEWSARMHGWRDVWASDGFVVMWTRVLADQATIPRLAGQITGERQITNFLHLGELLHGQAEATGNRPEELLQWLQQMVTDPQRRVEDQSQLRLETDAAAVQLCTIHKSKGLEYPIVYCPTLWSALSDRHVPDAVTAKLDADGRTLDSHEFDVGSELIEARRDWDRDEERAEDRRLLYVALTRAKHQCHVYWTAAKGSSRTALGQLMLGGEAKLHDDTLESRINSWLRGIGVERAELLRVATTSAAGAPACLNPRSETTPKLACRAVSRPVIRSLVQTSFTALSRLRATHHADDVADRDAVDAQQAQIDSAETSEIESRVPLAELSGGRQLGDVVHKVYEEVLETGELIGADQEAVYTGVVARLQPEMQRQQIDLESLEPLAKSITTSLIRPLSQDPQSPVPSCSLLDVEASRITCEMQFLMRLGLNDDPCDAADLAVAFERSGNDWVRGYSNRVRTMSSPGLKGFLAGFIDLVFEHDGRWYVLDYKTNNLGRSTGDYTPDRIRDAMVDHDYVLQYHLYTVALNAFLQRRVSGYDYATHFGGVVYLFVRAVQPENSTLDGIFFDYPDEAVISGLSQAIMGKLQAT